MSFDRNFGTTTLALPTLLLFLLEDFFDDPGIQHGGPPFGPCWAKKTTQLTSRTHAQLSVAPNHYECNPRALGLCFPWNNSNASKLEELHFRIRNSRCMSPHKSLPSL